MVSKSDKPDPVVVSTPLTYTVTITNTGPDTAQKVLVVTKSDKPDVVGGHGADFTTIRSTGTDTLPAMRPWPAWLAPRARQDSYGIAFSLLIC